jgi:hypothetical protein
VAAHPGDIVTRRYDISNWSGVDTRVELTGSTRTTGSLTKELVLLTRSSVVSCCSRGEWSRRYILNPHWINLNHAGHSPQVPDLPQNPNLGSQYMKRITYRKLSDIANILVAAAVESSDTMLLAVHSSLLQLTSIVRRQSVDFTVLQNILTQAEQSNATSTTNAPQAIPILAQAAVPQDSMQPIVPQVTTNHYLPPVPAVGQSKEGPTRKRRYPSKVMAMNGGSQQAPVPNQRRPPA